MVLQNDQNDQHSGQPLYRQAPSAKKLPAKSVRSHLIGVVLLAGVPKSLVFGSEFHRSISIMRLPPSSCERRAIRGVTCELAYECEKRVDSSMPQLVCALCCVRDIGVINRAWMVRQSWQIKAVLAALMLKKCPPLIRRL